VPQVEVTFDIDANGIVSVSAKDKATNKEQQIRIQPSGGLSKDDIEKMVRDAEANADEDKKRRELVELRNQADSLIHSTEKNLAEHGDKVSAEEKQAIEDGLQALKEVKDQDSTSEIEAKTQTLLQASMKLGEAMYKAQAATEAGAGATDDGGANAAEADGAKVVDAEFEEVENEDKRKTGS
jgi:molecular chaperone DnaK